VRLADPCGCFPTGRHYPGIAHLLQVRAVGVADELDPGARWVELPIAFIDTETTGKEPRTDRIIEIAVVLGRHGRVEARRSWLLDPEAPIPKESTAVHGIGDADVAGKPRFADVVGEVLASLVGAVPGAYNAAFDRSFLVAEVERCGHVPAEPPPALRREVDWMDPLVFARELFKGKGESRALGAVAERLGVSLRSAHRATDDAEAALEVLYALGNDDRVPKTYAALVREQRRLERTQDAARQFWQK
jgi:DNA polymerase-3 subunit epsilon